MAAPDLFLRSKAKVLATDLWLHGAGASGSAPPPAVDSGTVTSVVTASGTDVAGTTGVVGVDMGGGGGSPVLGLLVINVSVRVSLGLSVRANAEAVGDSDEVALILLGA